MKRLIILPLIFMLILSSCQQSNSINYDDSNVDSTNRDYSLTNEITPQTTDSSNKTSQNLTENGGNNNSPVQKAVCNDGTVIVLTEDGNVITWGSNYNGKIGNGEIESLVPGTVFTPVSPFYIDFNGKIIDVGCSQTTAYAITNAGEVFMWGRNEFGETGIPSGNILEPYKINIGKKIDKISSGYATNLYLTKDGEVFLSGIDVLKYDDLDDLTLSIAYEYSESISEEPYPLDAAEPGYTCVDLPFKCKDVSVGLMNYVFLSEEGKVYIKGNLVGDYEKKLPDIVHDELYMINFPERILSIESGSNMIVALSDSGNVYLYGRKESVFWDEQLDEELSENIFMKGGLKNIVSINCCLYCVTALDSSGSAWGFGIDNWGLIDQNNTDQNPSSFDIIMHPQNMRVKDAVYVTNDTMNSIIISAEGNIYIQGSDGAKQISFLDNYEELVNISTKTDKLF